MTRLVRKRKQLRMTQAEIARMLGITPQVYGRHERRGIRNVDMAVKYARHLGCRPEEILELPRIGKTINTEGEKNEGSGLYRLDHRLQHCGGSPLFGALRQRQSAEIGAEEGEGIPKPENRHPDAGGPDPET